MSEVRTYVCQTGPYYRLGSRVIHLAAGFRGPPVPQTTATENVTCAFCHGYEASTLSKAKICKLYPYRQVPNNVPLAGGKAVVGDRRGSSTRPCHLAKPVPEVKAGSATGNAKEPISRSARF